jgi:hypothetical protein
MLRRPIRPLWPHGKRSLPRTRSRPPHHTYDGIGAAGAPTVAASSGATAASAPPLVVRLADDGSTVRFDRWQAEARSEFERWQRRVGAPGGEAAASADKGVVPMEEDEGGAVAMTAQLRRLVLRDRRHWHARACVVSLPRATSEALRDCSWLCQLLLCEASHALREEAAALLTGLADHPPGRAIRFLNLLVAMLPQAVAMPRCAAEYFELLRHLMASEGRRLYLVARGLLGTLCTLIGAEAQRLRDAEVTSMVDMAHGSMLKVIVSLLQSLLVPTTAMARFRREERMPTLLHALLCVRGLVMQKTSLTAECSSRPAAATERRYTRGWSPTDGAFCRRASRRCAGMPKAAPRPTPSGARAVGLQRPSVQPCSRG